MVHYKMSAQAAQQVDSTKWINLDAYTVPAQVCEAITAKTQSRSRFLQQIGKEIPLSDVLHTAIFRIGDQQSFEASPEHIDLNTWVIRFVESQHPADIPASCVLRPECSMSFYDKYGGIVHTWNPFRVVACMQAPIERRNATHNFIVLDHQQMHYHFHIEFGTLSCKQSLSFRKEEETLAKPTESLPVKTAVATSAPTSRTAASNTTEVETVVEPVAVQATELKPTSRTTASRQSVASTANVLERLTIESRKKSRTPVSSRTEVAEEALAPVETSAAQEKVASRQSQAPSREQIIQTISRDFLEQSFPSQ